MDYLRNIIHSIKKIIGYSIVHNTARPKDIPPLVPDCGFNHGENHIVTKK